MFAINHRRRSSSVSRRGRQVPITEQLEVRALMTSWVGQIGGAGYDATQSRTSMDTAGNSYLGGSFTGVADFDLGAGTASLTSAGSEDAYIAKYAPNGGLLWARSFGGSLHESTSSVRIDPVSGSVYATGTFRGSVDFTGDGVADLTSAGDSDVFIVKLDPNTGNTIWQKRIGGTGADSSTDIAAADGNVYVVGRFRETVDFDPGVGVQSLTSSGKGNTRTWDGFILKLDANGTYVSAGQVGGSDIDSIKNIIVDGPTLYVSGEFNGTADLDPSAGVQSRTSNGGTNTFFASYTTAGAFQWVQTLGGPLGNGGSWDLGSDTDSLYLTGNFFGTVDFDPSSGTKKLTSAGGNDASIAKYSKSTGGLKWAQRYGSTGDDIGKQGAVVNSTDGTVYWGGQFSGTVDFNPGVSGGELTSAGLHDGFLLKLDANGSYLNSWRTGSSAEDGASRPIGVMGSTLYATGGFQGTASFPSGGILTSYGGYDGFLMAVEEAVPAPSPLLAASVPLTSVGRTLVVSPYEAITVVTQSYSGAGGVNTSAATGVHVAARKVNSPRLDTGAQPTSMTNAAAPLIDAVFSQLTIRDLDLFGTLLSRH